MRKQAVEGDDATVRRLEAYVDRFREDGQRQGGRLSVDSGGPIVNRTRGISVYPEAQPKPAPGGRANTPGPVVQQAIGQAQESALSNFADSMGRKRNGPSLEEIDRLRLGAMRSFQTRLFGQMDPVGCRATAGDDAKPCVAPNALRAVTDFLQGRATHAITKIFCDWTGLRRSTLH